MKLKYVPPEVTRNIAVSWPNKATVGIIIVSAVTQGEGS